MRIFHAFACHYYTTEIQSFEAISLKFLSNKMTIYNNSYQTCFSDTLTFARPINNLSVKQGWVFLGWTSTTLGYMCLAQGQQRNDAGEVQTRSPSVSSQALYHWATALPRKAIKFCLIQHFEADFQKKVSLKILPENFHPCVWSLFIHYLDEKVWILLMKPADLGSTEYRMVHWIS